MVTQSKRVSHSVINTCVMVILFILGCVWSCYNNCRIERKQEEVKLVVRLGDPDTLRNTLPIDTLSTATRKGQKGHIIAASTVECIPPENHLLIIITNKGKKPVGIQSINLKTFGGERTLWGSGWLDASSNKPIVFPFYLKPDTSLQLTCASAIDTTVLNFNTLYIELTETGERKQYALRRE